MNQAFEDWKAEAKAVTVLEAAQMCGAKLRRAGREYTAPCPAGCCKRDGFIVTPAKNIFLCRKSGATGDAIALIMHCMDLDFKGACEFLTNRPPPNSRSGGVDHEARKRTQERIEANKREQERAGRDQARKALNKRQNARDYWNGRVGLESTPPGNYLLQRLIADAHKIPALGAHARVYHEFEKKALPALIGCVVGPDKSFRGIWRIYVDDQGNKAKVDGVKLGLGKPEGGAVWIASRDQMQAEVWGVCEGIETALSVRALYNLPVFAALSTSGMSAFEVPPFVKHLAIYPDGDLPFQNNKGGWMEPPGMAAARKLSERLRANNFSHEIIEPPQDGDWNDVLKHTKEKGLV